MDEGYTQVRLRHREEGPRTVSPCECEPPSPQTVLEPNPQALKPGRSQ